MYTNNVHSFSSKTPQPELQNGVPKAMLLRRNELLISVLFLFYSSIACSQDTLSLFYNSGEHRLTSDSKMQLTEFLFSKKISTIDSISVIGFADSTGRKTHNYRISKRRANAVHQFIVHLLPDSISIRQSAKGEEKTSSKQHSINHRRVDVVLYTPFLSEKSALYTSDNRRDSLSNNCYVLADSILARCHVSYFKKGNTTYVQLALEAQHLSPKQKLYTLSSKTRVAKLVKWKLEISGDYWWKRARYTTTLKASDFERFGLLEKQSPVTDSAHCTICDTDPFVTWQLSDTRTPDVFVLQNLELRKRFLFDEYLFIVPKEYVTLSKTYTTDPEGQNGIAWYTKSGRENATYYFADIPIQQLSDTNWSIYSFKAHCPDVSSATGQTYQLDTLPLHFCPQVSDGSIHFSYGLTAVYRNFQQQTAYVGSYLQLNFGRIELAALGAIDLKKRPLFSLQLDYTLLSFTPFSDMRICKVPRPIVDHFHRVVTTYAGSSINSAYATKQALFQEIHVGIAYCNRPFSLDLERIFAQGGIGFDYLNSLQTLTFYFQAGLRFKI